MIWNQRALETSSSEPPDFHIDSSLKFTINIKIVLGKDSSWVAMGEFKKVSR